MADGKKKTRAKGRISAKYALSDDEMDFCKRYLAFGKVEAAEAYRRSFLRDSTEKVQPKEVSRRANLLLAKPYIVRYLEEMESDAGTLARDVLADQVRFTSDAVAARAAQKVLEQEDKHGFREAAERWAEIMCAIGAEVVVPVPGGGEIAFELREMFPRYRDALPPADVLDKTIRALQGYQERVNNPIDYDEEA